MFNWSDNGKFPFMGMMNMDNGNNTNPMNFMQQAFMMQMQFMQNMTMMQMQFMERPESRLQRSPAQSRER